MKPEETLLKQDTLQLTRANNSISNLEAIEAYLNAGGEGIILTDIQEQLLDRWTYADELMRQNIGKLKREEIANRIKIKYFISKSLAYRDIVNAEKVFSTSTPLNKKYRIQLRIEFLENQIRLCAAVNDHFSAAQYEKVLQNYYKIYPETIIEDSPKTLIFSFDINKLQDHFIDKNERDGILNKQANKNKLLDALSLDIDEDDDVEEVDI